jgi:nucleoside-diphosphate-sugar epimerase
MRVLVVGATGVIGTRLVYRLRQQGHEVTGTSRSPGKAGRLRDLGAEPAALDALDAGPSARQWPPLRPRRSSPGHRAGRDEQLGRRLPGEARGG